MNDKTILYIVVPCYNEEEVLSETTKRLNEKLNSLIENKKVSKYSRVLFVDDGSNTGSFEKTPYVLVSCSV